MRTLKDIVAIHEPDETHPDNGYGFVGWVVLFVAGLFIAIGAGLIVGWVFYYVNIGEFLK